MTTLAEKWQDKESWLRCLHVQTSIMWLYRQQLIQLELGELRWLDGILRDILRAIAIHAPRAATSESAFQHAMELLRATIEAKIASVGADNELKLLLRIALDAEAHDL